MEYGRHDHLKQSPARFLKKSCILHDLVGLDARRPVNVTGLRVGWTRITELATSSLACTSNSKCAKTSLLFRVRFYENWRDR